MMICKTIALNTNKFEEFWLSIIDTRMLQLEIHDSQKKLYAS